MIELGKNQYLFTKESCGNIRYDKCIEVKDYKLYLGEECNATSYNDNNTDLIVIGYAVDVLNPDASMDKMIFDLTEKMSKREIGPDSTANWCGRWVIIVFVDNEIICWHDACGLKQVFYDTKNDIIASQARYIASISEYKQSDAAAEYMELAMKSDKEYSLPVDKTMYSKIKRLLPNHVLNVSDKTTKRAALNISSQNYNVAVKKCSQSICNAMEAVANRYKLFVTLTAGWDSRLVLSACNNIQASYDVITFKYAWMTDDNEDITVAKKLCDNLNLKHMVLLCDDCEDEFAQEYCNHSENPHKYWIQMARAIKNHGYGILVKGSCNEVLRMINGNLYNWQITPRMLCSMFNIPVTDFSIDAVKKWLKSAEKFCKENHLNILDLFYWEHRMGSWLAECCNENDVVGEMFTPFNSRNYLENGLSINKNKRDALNQYFIIGLLKENWKAYRVDEWIYINKTIPYVIKNIIKNRVPLIYGIYVMVKYTARRDRAINE